MDMRTSTISPTSRFLYCDDNAASTYPPGFRVGWDVMRKEAQRGGFRTDEVTRANRAKAKKRRHK